MSALDASTADRVVHAVQSCPHVAGLGRGIATHLAGRRVDGVRRRDGRIEVRIVARPTRPLPEIAADVRAAVEHVVDGPVDVMIDDLAVADDGSGTGP